MKCTIEWISSLSNLNKISITPSTIIMDDTTLFLPTFKKQWRWSSFTPHTDEGNLDSPKTLTNQVSSVRHGWGFGPVFFDRRRTMKENLRRPSGLGGTFFRLPGYRRYVLSGTHPETHSQGVDSVRRVSRSTFTVWVPTGRTWSTSRSG